MCVSDVETNEAFGKLSDKVCQVGSTNNVHTISFRILLIGE